MNQDIDELALLLQEAIDELKSGTKNIVYELGIVYTAIRDLAMSASWALLGAPCFSSDAPYKLPNPCPLEVSTYNAAKLSRHSSTRGVEVSTDLDETVSKIVRAPLGRWVETLRGE
jgi:hypothetical protein